MDKAKRNAGVPDEDELNMKRAAREADEQEGKRPARAGKMEEKILDDEKDEVDEASEDSFPASDPPSYSRR